LEDLLYAPPPPGDFVIFWTVRNLKMKEWPILTLPIFPSVSPHGW
jgi:hypothetical protein